MMSLPKRIDIFKLPIVHKSVQNQYPLDSSAPFPPLTAQIHTHFWQEDSPAVFRVDRLFDFTEPVVLASADEDDMPSESSSL